MKSNTERKMDDVEFNEIKSQSSAIGNEMYQLMVDLFPICRSITGNAVRETHKIISKHIQIQTHEIPTGTKVFDWIIPKEWNIKDAYIIDPDGKKIIDFKKSNLHVVSYSVPVNTKMSLQQLIPHLHYLKEQPDVIPYLTSYYKEDWGFCLSYNQFLTLKDGEYQAVIDSSLQTGSLTYSEHYKKGEKKDEMLISCYTCHPSLCNDNLSGVVLTTFLAKYLDKIQLNYSYRFLFIPETIGAISWLALNEKNISNIKYGLVATCLGDGGKFTYKKSRQDDSKINKVVINVLRNSESEYQIIDFFPMGSDERQFCSPAFNLPVGSLMRSIYGTGFKEYHTSADNLEFVQSKYLAESFLQYLSVIYVIENNDVYLNLNPKCEPQLSKRGLYNTIGGQKNSDINKDALRWVLNLSDGNNSLLDISNRSGLNFGLIKSAADALVKHDLLKKIET